ncbi:hypothetical protein BYT27DRAFT_7094222 [Phlegmacium glaucopus]|nr:hypothetical protein BYT27DRAFT_7094222 [Phlegmacium glaucopus]
MPVATSSRQKLTARRRDSSDIENTRPTQANDNEDDVSEDDRPRQKMSVKLEKKTNGKIKGKRRADADDDDEDLGSDYGADDDDDEDRIDVDNFPDHPLQHADLLKLKGISKDWESMQRQTWDKWDSIKDVAAAMAEARDGDPNQESVDELDLIMREFLDVAAEMTAQSQTLDDLHQQVARGEQINNVIERYKAGLQDRLEDYAGKTTRQKYAKNPKYLEFRSSIWNGDDSDEDDDLEIGGATQNFNCPLTLTPLVNPVTSSVCKHSFSADAIRDYFKKSPGRELKCPASGCNKTFKLSDCRSDDVLAKKVRAHQRRAAAAADDHSDAEEVIE